jgi:8-amino-7-oxononanoate synthase
VIVGDSLRAARLSEMLVEAGINVQPMVAPSVPNDQARLRFFIATTHTERDLDCAVEVLVRALHDLDEPEAVAAGAAVARGAGA